MVRAALEAVAYQSKELLDAMQKDASVAFGEGGTEGHALKVDGGMTANNMLMQFQSDITGRRVVRPVVAETTSLGAAYAAGLAVGFWSDTADLKKQWKASQEWAPAMPREQVGGLLARWDTAVQRTMHWKDISGAKPPAPAMPAPPAAAAAATLPKPPRLPSGGNPATRTIALAAGCAFALGAATVAAFKPGQQPKRAASSTA